MFLPLSFSESETNGIKYFVHFSAFLRLIDWLIDWLTSREQYYSYIQDDNEFNYLYI
jgi:hypothetical protein